MSRTNQTALPNKVQSTVPKHHQNQERIVQGFPDSESGKDVNDSSSLEKEQYLFNLPATLGHTLSQIAIGKNSKDINVNRSKIAPAIQMKKTSIPIQMEDSEAHKKVKQKGILPGDEEQFLGLFHGYLQEFDRRHLRIGAGLRRDDSPYGRKHHSASFQVDHGVWGTPGRDARIGSKGDAKIFGFDTGHQHSFGVDGGLAGANYDFSVGDDGFAAGAGAFYAQGAGSVGNISNKDQNDERLRLGGSLGVGFGFRASKSDRDKDNIPEYNYGFDLGPLSFDISTEDPLLTLLKGGIAPLGWGLDLSTSDANTNLTNDVWNWT